MSNKRDKLLNDIFFKTDKQINLAKKYNVSTGYVSQLATKLTQLQVIPKHNGKTLKCSNCYTNEVNLVFHHDHKTGQLIALVCQKCNIRLKNHDLNGKGMIENKEKVVSCRLTNEVYEKFKEYCDSRNKRLSTALTEIVEVIIE